VCHLQSGADGALGIILAGVWDAEADAQDVGQRPSGFTPVASSDLRKPIEDLIFNLGGGFETQGIKQRQ
jgi:hypothetical protein